MNPRLFEPDRTAVIILGASDWSNVRLESSDAFLNSASDFADYLRSPTGLGIPTRNIKDLFDSSHSGADQIKEIRDFLVRRSKRGDDGEGGLSDLIVYYTGHGSFNFHTNDYFLLIRDTEYELEFATGLNFKTLATCLINSNPHLRRFIILDCCFAGAAAGQMPGSTLQLQAQDEVQLAVRQMEAALPGRGTLILAASSGTNAARFDPTATHTMFTGALHEVLVKGVQGSAAGGMFSFQSLRDFIWDKLREKYEHQAVRPELHVPDQRDGDLRLTPAFPNPIKAKRAATRTRQKRKDESIVTPEPQVLTEAPTQVPNDEILLLQSDQIVDRETHSSDSTGPLFESTSRSDQNRPETGSGPQNIALIIILVILVGGLLMIIASSGIFGGGSSSNYTAASSGDAYAAAADAAAAADLPASDAAGGLVAAAPATNEDAAAAAASDAATAAADAGAASY